MKSFRNRLISFLLFCLLIGSAFALPVSAYCTADFPDVYDSYTLPFGYDIAQSYFSACSYDALPDGTVLHTNRETQKIWWEACRSDRTIVYGTPEDIEELRQFILDNHTNGKLAITDEAYGLYFSARFETSFLETLSAGKETDPMPVTELNLYRQVMITDASCTVYRVIGGIYDLGDGYAYLDYDALDNSHFNADGSFSYRSGEVSLFRLDPDIADILAEADKEGNARFTEYAESEDDTDPYNPDDPSGTFGTVLFVAYFIILGLIVPAAPFIVGILLARRKNNPHAKRWLSLPGLAGMWILLASVMFIIILCA